MEAAGLLIVAMAAGAVIGLLLQATLLLLGAKILGIQDPTFGKALVVALLGAMASIGLWLFLGHVPVFGPVMAFLGGFIVGALIMMPIFGASFGRALGAAIMAWVLGWLIIGGMALIFAALFLGGVATLL